MRGKARAVLESVQNLENLDFSELKSKLELRFGEAQLLQNYYSQFTNRKQKFGENIASFGSDIGRLSQLAYPECSDSIRDKVRAVRLRFIRQIRKESASVKGATFVRIAIERAKAIKLIQENSFQYKKENNFNFRKKKEKDFSNSDKGKGNQLNKKKRRKI